MVADRISRSIVVLSYYAEHYGVSWEVIKRCAVHLFWMRIPAEYKMEIMGIATGVRMAGYKNVTWQDIWASNNFFEVSGTICLG